MLWMAKKPLFCILQNEYRKLYRQTQTVERNRFIKKTSNVPQNQKYILIERGPWQHEQNNPMTFQLNNIYYKNINVKPLT